MASLYSIARKNGKAWKIGLSNGKQQTTISLGKMSKKAAELCCSMVEQIAASNAAGQSYSVEVATWSANIGDELHAKLVNAGLLRQRQRRTLETFLDDFVKEHSHWKSGTVAAFSTSKDLILDYFGEGTSIEKISVDDAVAFRLELQESYREATIAKIIRHCRQVFKLARRRKLIVDNPFETVKTGSQRNPARFYFVSMDEYRQLLEGCTNAKQRLIVCLARIGGIRCPIDLCGLRWSEINWQGKWFWVHSAKTEHYVGKDKRQVPLFPETERCFQEFYDTLPEGCDDLIFPEKSDIPPTISPKKSLSSWIHKVANRAGVELWQKPFQNCRSSRDTELRKIFPEYLVNRWIGHTQQVAEAHYTQTLPSDFIDAYNAEKTVVEHAGIGCSGGEVAKKSLTLLSAYRSSFSSVCNAIPCGSKGSENVPSRLGKT
jgi:integrase